MSGKEVGTLRSDFVVHWTGGKDIEKEFADLNSPDYHNCALRRQKYLDRLKTTLKDGLWMNYVSLELYVARKPQGVVRKVLPRAKWPVTCFTEISPAHAHEHVKSYGYLGFGFSREFVLERHGAPVFYIPGEKELAMEASDMVPWHFYKWIDILSHLVSQMYDEKALDSIQAEFTPRKGLVYCKFEEFRKACCLKEYLDLHNYDEQDLAVFPKLRASLMTFSIFLKPMSDGECSRPFQRLDEAEWRLPCVRGKEELFKPTGVGRPPFKLPFCPSDMEVLVFPDPKTRDMAWADRDIARKLSQIKGGTPTVDECRDT